MFGWNLGARYVEAWDVTIPYRYLAEGSSLVHDQQTRTYRLRPERIEPFFPRWQGVPWRELILEVFAPEPAAVEIASVELVQRAPPTTTPRLHGILSKIASGPFPPRLTHGRGEMNVPVAIRKILTHLSRQARLAARGPHEHAGRSGSRPPTGRVRTPEPASPCAGAIPPRWAEWRTKGVHRGTSGQDDKEVAHD